MTIITPQIARGLALTRAAESMLRTLGGVEIAVRFASPTTPSSSEFGLAASATTDVPLSPVLVRTASAPQTTRVPHPQGGALGARLDTVGTALDFVFPAAAVQQASQLDGYASPIDWFTHALGIFFDNTLHPIMSIATENFAGQPYLYRVTTK